MKPGTHCQGGWICFGAGLDGYGRYRFHRTMKPEPRGISWIAEKVLIPQQWLCSMELLRKQCTVSRVVLFAVVFDTSVFISKRELDYCWHSIITAEFTKVIESQISNSRFYNSFIHNCRVFKMTLQCEKPGEGSRRPHCLACMSSRTSSILFSRSTSIFDGKVIKITIVLKQHTF